MNCEETDNLVVIDEEGKFLGVVTEHDIASKALQIEDVWENIMGKTIARYTDKLQIIGDKLIINTKVAPLRQELIYQKEKIKQRVNEALGQRVIMEVVIQ